MYAHISTNDKYSNVSFQVRYSLYNNGLEVAFIEFNGTGSNIEDWFSNGRILEASWSDLDTSTTFNYFSIKG